MNGDLAILLFLAFSIFLLFASLKLVAYAEVIIQKTKFGGAFIGGVLIAAITSIPELITEIAQGIGGHPGAGAADDLGSNAFSALLIAIAAIFLFKNKFLSRLDHWTKITLVISAVLAFAVGGFMILNKDINIGKEGIYAIGLIPLFFFLFYIYSLRLSYKYGTADDNTNNVISSKYKNISVKKAIIMFTFYSFLIIIFSLFVNWSADVMMVAWKIDSKSIGGVFLAMTTSLPEIVAFFLFIKKKQPIAAISSLIGSHIFNIGIQFFGDLSFSNSATYNTQDIHQVWPLAIMTGCMMVFISLQAYLGKKINNKWFRLILPSLAMATYIVGWILIIFL